MLTYVVGDLFRSPAHVLVNTVNTVGVMGKGIAKTFKQIYPEMFEKYRQLCETGALTVGKLWIYKTPNKWILNFPTKTTWRQPSRLEYIEQGLSAFLKAYADRGVTSIAFPALGCGNGELDWENQVRPLMEQYLKPLPIDIFIYVYRKNSGIPEHKNIQDISGWLRQQPELLGFSEVQIDLKKIIGAGIHLKSFYEDQTFSVQWVEQEERIAISVGHNTEFIYFEELLEFWSLIRSYGFGFPAVLPASVAPYRTYLLALFAKLPYCYEVMVSKNYGALGTYQARSIQYIPQSTYANELFNGTPEHLIAV